MGQIDSHKRITQARWCSDPPAVDDFAFAGWKDAMPIHLNRYWSGADAPIQRHAELRLLWSASGLHALFDCRQAEPIVANANPETGKKTPGLWDRDVCEIFVAPDKATPENYFEFEAAPTGEWLDVGIRFVGGERQSDWEFHSGLKVAAKTEGTRILIGMFIPWGARLQRPQERESWRANFYRCIGSGADRGYLAWQPTFSPEPNFHVPSAFGWLEFA